ncbi:hypothetical protein [Halocella sp. SP3-1]|uniref:hypothetical protein n=1 Tax=Halocella sp. SP3-1 TaxID=2382161 RepID=UPI000F751F21|nr:hypothetical protein [Halocella sp. SP3-1]AZO94097.1 hypothetical protein D7D81_05535 [Halocella sp. SP3-1]
MGVVREKKKIGWPVIILIILAPFILRFAVGLFTGHDIEDVRVKIEEHLYEKYGEEFVVTQIGTRTFGGKKYYQAKIYPKSIIGTNKYGDEYYSATASIDILSFGRLDEPGDSYGRVIARKKALKYLTPKIKEIFGERVRLKPKITYHTRNKYGVMVGYLTPDFDMALRKSIEDPENNRLELDLDVYIFKRIENEEEKEERRKEIFELVQYLKEEGLFEYLEMRIFFIDERVLAPSYTKVAKEIYSSCKVKEQVDGQKGRAVKLPPLELREKVSKVLQKEIDKMSEKELLTNMNKIRKDQLTYKRIRKNNNHYMSYIYSESILRERYGHDSDYEKIRDYDNVGDVVITDNLEYVYVD